MTGHAAAYRFSEPLSYRVRDYTTTSHYLLYDSGAFALHYASPVEFQYVGIYAQENSRVSFDFSPVDGRWDAIGTLNGDLLEVRYSEMMEHADFENAVYRRSQ